MKKILIIWFAYSKRVIRQLLYLRDKYEVYAVGVEDPHIEGIRFFKVEPVFRRMNFLQKAITACLLECRQFEAAYRKMYSYHDVLDQLSSIRFDLILAHDVKPLPLVYQLDRNPNLLIDVHEYYFDMSNQSIPLIKRFDDYLINTYFFKCTNFFTVSQGIAHEYGKKMGNKFEVITNAHDYVALSPIPVQNERIRIIHHGFASNARNLETMLEMMDSVDARFHLDLMLTTLTFEDSYIARLQKMAGRRENVTIIPPVKPNDIVTFTNQYDIGLYILAPTSFNTHHALPNKFFEFIQARLCIAIGPSLEMARIVKQYDLGVVAEDFQPQTMATLLNRLTSEQIMNYKRQCHQHAYLLSSESEMEKVGELIAKLT